MIGVIEPGLLTVIFIENTENVVRLISARRASRKERLLYEEKIKS